MTPTTDDQGRWLEVAFAVIAVLWSALQVILLRIIPTKDWVMKALGVHAKEDVANDRQLFLDLISSHLAPLNTELGSLKGEIATLHQENTKKLDEILTVIKEHRRHGR